MSPCGKWCLDFAPESAVRSSTANPAIERQRHPPGPCLWAFFATLSRSWVASPLLWIGKVPPVKSRGLHRPPAGTEIPQRLSTKSSPREVTLCRTDVLSQNWIVLARWCDGTSFRRYIHTNFCEARKVKAYTLKKNGDTDELHLFEGDFTDGVKCTSVAKSICQKMAKTDSGGNTFVCQTDDAARVKCAQAGRLVCGVCVSHLYTTY